MTPHGHKDEAVIADAYRRYGHALYRRALSLLAQPEDAHDIVQETFCQFWQRRERFRGQSSLFTYLYRITTNLSIDRLRRRKTAGPAIDADHVPLATPGDSGRVAAAEELAVLLEGLDEETVMIGVLAHLDRMTQDEIGLACDLSRRTIGKRLQRFAEHIRRQRGGP